MSAISRQLVIYQKLYLWAFWTWIKTNLFHDKQEGVNWTLFCIKHLEFLVNHLSVQYFSISNADIMLSATYSPT